MRLGVFEMRMVGGFSTFGDRLSSRWPPLILGVVACVAPAYLFAHSLSHSAFLGDDWAYITRSRSLSRTIENLLYPHNVHVVPVWRALTWGLVALGSGKLSRIQPMLDWAAYAILVVAIILTGRLVTRETGRLVIGLAAMFALGSNSLAAISGTWFSASQAMAAGVGVLLTLWFVQGWRISGNSWRLLFAGLSTWIAGGLWSVGHVAGPVAAAYLLAAGGSRCRRAVMVPLAFGVVAVAATVWLCGDSIKEQGVINFGGRTPVEAMQPLTGMIYTLRAVVERLLFGEIGLVADVAMIQILVILTAIATLWLYSRRSIPSPLESAGLLLILLSYGFEWTFRAYLPFEDLRGKIPSYDTIPHVGAILFLAGWWAAMTGSSEQKAPIRRSQIVGLLAFQVALLLMHQTWVDARFTKTITIVVRPMTASESERFSTPRAKRDWAVRVASVWVASQRRQLLRIDEAQGIAQANSIGRETLIPFMGERFLEIPLPSTTPTYSTFPSEDRFVIPNAPLRCSVSRLRSIPYPEMMIDAQR